MFVLDVSIAVAWHFADERGPAAIRAAARVAREEALVPGHFWLELANALLVAARAGRFAAESVDAALADMVELPIVTDPAGSRARVRDVARWAARLRLTSYDAAYVELAAREALPLMSADRALRRAALVAGVILA
jgi:predicted nucleic acid-binding protein